MNSNDDCGSQEVNNKEERNKKKELLMKEEMSWKKEEMLEKKMSEEEILEAKMLEEEKRWKEDSLRKLANIQIKKVDRTRGKECLREKGEGSRNSEENFNVIEVLVSRDGYNLID